MSVESKKQEYLRKWLVHLLLGVKISTNEKIGLLMIGHKMINNGDGKEEILECWKNEGYDEKYFK